jgi:hypothetical protein
MNEYEVEEAYRRYCDHPVLGPAVETLNNLVTWTNQNSDGWCYWPKPSNAARKLQELIEGYRDPNADRCPSCYALTTKHDRFCDRPDATPAQLKAALTPIKAFRTRYNREAHSHMRCAHPADFKIVNPPKGDSQ